MTRTYDHIALRGHAENKIVCAMATALTVALMKNITERYKDKAEYKLSDGEFYLNTRDLSVESDILVDAFWYSMLELSKSYPMSFQVDENTDYRFK